jgi:glycosyltransferase involved in cell wall biosynthesis
MPAPSATHGVILPSYNSGPRLVQTVAEVLRAWQPVWLVADGSTDGSAEPLRGVAGLRLIERPRNGGKGAAVLEGLRAAAAAGLTHVLVMDADGQHPADSIAAFMQLSAQTPGAMILGQPVFGPEAPRLRVWGRRLSNTLARWETGQDTGDALFGLRVYPLAPLLALMQRRRLHGYDFDTAALVELVRQGVPFLKRDVPVRYLRAAEGGVSHFRYGRDNLRLAALHARLLLTPCRR